MNVMMFIVGLSSKYSNARPLLSNPTTTSSVASTYHLLREMYEVLAEVFVWFQRRILDVEVVFSVTSAKNLDTQSGIVRIVRIVILDLSHLLVPKLELPPLLADQPPAYTLSEEDYHRLQQLLASYLDSSWVVDSGAMHHMTRIKVSFLAYIKLSINLLDFGSIKNLTNLRFSSILFVPKFPNNLCSLSQITKQNNCSATFFPTHCIFQELGTNRLIGTGFESRGLYHLSLPSCPLAKICDSSIRKAHCRLGHPSATILRQMRSNFPLSSINFHCKSRQLGKHTRRPYPLRVSSRVGFSFELVHSDGPCPIKSTLGFEYFITFINDYSRATWVYLLKSRSEVFTIFREIHSYIRNHFNSSIKTLRSDNAKEYFSTDFSSYLKTHGIIHEPSYVYTSQQNGVRKVLGTKSKKKGEKARKMNFLETEHSCDCEMAIPHRERCYTLEGFRTINRRPESSKVEEEQRMNLKLKTMLKRSEKSLIVSLFSVVRTIPRLTYTILFPISVAERKNRHLLDVARTLMFQSYVPKRFWGDAILTAAYVINRIPTPVLHGKSLFSVLFPKGTPFPLTPRIFGWVSYVHDHSQQLTKLDPRAIRCVFLGYLRKGYRCYSSFLHPYFTSADVTFHESCPYFLEHSHPVFDSFPDDNIPDSPLIPTIPVSVVHSVPPVSDAPTSATMGLPGRYFSHMLDEDQTIEPLDSQPNHDSSSSSVALPMNEPNTPMPAKPLLETTIPPTISFSLIFSCT
ncbi:LOW QUALITY PROTEIN: hypothetical protein OSB04_002993 [Centaurea solstitialis]|uniref:Integrase catalytic domain-containing protein n=1 Tax=Centaurea solstitialis TaxID=347529 RepID=A0AA38UBE8_9ASTR|nr:LOW QUALITY PROTEIN: hypothetical protein OSB04_002993 [Centaurea solstitialis]